MASAPAPPSSAGWKITTAVPAKLRVSARYLAAPKQHRGVAVVAAGVHLAGHRRFVRQAGLLLERQRIHVGAQPHHLAAGLAPGLAAADDADDAGAADTRHHLVAAEAFELVGNGSRRAVHVILQLRVHVHVAAPGGDLVVQVGDAIDDRHGFFLARRLIQQADNLAKFTQKGAQGWQMAAGLSN